jgi:hypothetical protein
MPSSVLVASLAKLESRGRLESPAPRVGSVTRVLRVLVGRQVKLGLRALKVRLGILAVKGWKGLKAIKARRASKAPPASTEKVVAAGRRATTALACPVRMASLGSVESKESKAHRAALATPAPTAGQGRRGTGALKGRTARSASLALMVPGALLAKKAMQASRAIR